MFGRETGRKEDTTSDRRKRLENILKMFLQEIECGCVNWVYLAEARAQWRALVNTVMNV
jgi:hypothetical protein